MDTEGLGSPEFCTGGLKVAQIVFFAKIAAYLHELRFFFLTPYFYFRFGVNYMSASTLVTSARYFRRQEGRPTSDIITSGLVAIERSLNDSDHAECV